MSKWVDFRDELLDVLDFDTVTEQMKENTCKWLLSELLPLAKEKAELFTTEVKAQAKDESGWCKFRDAVVLPLVVKGLLAVVEKALVQPTK